MQLKSSDFLLNIRLCVSSVTVAHLVFAAITFLPIDMSQDEDPRISAYGMLKWKLLTTWFNYKSFIYNGGIFQWHLDSSVNGVNSFVVAHLVFAAIVLLPIDMSQDEDPRISVYARLKWKLLTTWFNILMLAYFPVSIYCDWKQKKGEWNNKQVRMLRNVKDIVMTSILFPTIMYSDYFFWRMWYQDPSLIAPLGIFKYLPSWGQHSLHTVSGFTVLLDILLTPRRRPNSILPGSMLMFAFCVIYSLVITVSYYHGEVVYSVIEIFNKQQIILLISLAFIEHIFFFTLQWCIIDSVHGKQVKNRRKCS